MWEWPTYDVQEGCNEQCGHIDVDRLTRAPFALAGFARHRRDPGVGLTRP